jgi:hypothetical protein
MASHAADAESKRLLLEIAVAYDRLASLAGKRKDADKAESAN